MVIFIQCFMIIVFFLKDEKKEVINNIYNKLHTENKTENISLGDDEIDKKKLFHKQLMIIKNSESHLNLIKL